MSTEVSLLLVEDETLFHAILQDALGDAGFQLIIAANAKSAIAELDAGAARFGGVLTDIRLGTGLTGWDVGRYARELVPEMPVVYMSGDSADEWASQGVPNSVMVPKPYAVAQIVTAISTLLNRNTV